jgi:hypothetical protein
VLLTKYYFDNEVERNDSGGAHGELHAVFLEHLSKSDYFEHLGLDGRMKLVWGL